MNKWERDVISRLHQAVTTIPGVRNPRSDVGHMLFYRDMSEARVYYNQVMVALLDADPAYRQDNRLEIEQLLRDLEDFIKLRKAEKWGSPSAFAYRFMHYG